MTALVLLRGAPSVVEWLKADEGAVAVADLDRVADRGAVSSHAESRPAPGGRAEQLGQLPTAQGGLRFSESVTARTHRMTRLSGQAPDHPEGVARGEVDSRSDLAPRGRTRRSR